MTKILNSVPERQFHTYFSALHRFVPTSAIFIERFDNQKVTDVLLAIFFVWHLIPLQQYCEEYCHLDE
jgi:hypothetical protein